MRENVGWYVQRLILDNHLIQEELYRPNSDLFDSDLHSDLILVLDMIKKLEGLGILSHYEVVLLGVVENNGGNFTLLQELLGMQRDTIKTHFISACSKISYWLAGHFIDIGYIDYVWERNKLTFEKANLTRQVVEDKILEHITGKYKHTIRRTGINE